MTKGRKGGKKWRLGLKLGPNYLGFAAVEIAPDPNFPGEYYAVGLLKSPKPPITGREQFPASATFDGKVDHAVRSYLREAGRYSVGEIHIKRYTNRSFPRSRAAKEGGSLKDHDRLADAVGARLEEAGLKVYWDVMK